MPRTPIFTTKPLRAGVRIMLNVQSRAVAFARPLSIRLFHVALCLALVACGGGDDGAPDAVAAEAVAPPATATPPTTVTAQIAALEQRQTTLSAASSGTSAIDGVRADVTAFIAALTVTDTQRTVLYQAARALEATLTVDLARRAELQTTVDNLALAQACTRTRFTDGEVVWGALRARTYDTLRRRLRLALFIVASRLLTDRPAHVVCTSAPPPGNGDGGSGNPPPPPPPPSAALQLREEIARLEQQGVLPTLDRGTDIRGPDSNDNGVRDDIDAYIAALPITDAQKKAAMQRARNQQSKLFVDPTDKQAVVSLSQQSIAATKCMADVFEGAAADWSDDLSFRIQAITANTPERAKRHMHYMAALSGTSVSYPRGNTCEE